MKTFALWLLGTIAGLVVCIVLAKQTSTRTTIDPSRRALELGGRASQAMKEAFGGFSAVLEKLPKLMEREGSAADSALAAANSEAHIHYPMPFSEPLLSELEKKYDTLPQEAEVTAETNGWRIVRLQANSTLAKGGFKQGDFISSENLDAALATLNEKQSALAKRAYRILKHITN